MTREEEIQKAANIFCNEICPQLLVGEYSFIQGVKWADNHPVNVWHNASEEPRRNELLLGVDNDGVSLYKWCLQEVCWEDVVNYCALKKWAYIDDLLPKGGTK